MAFEYKNYFELRNMPPEELYAYYRAQRKYEYDSKKPLESSDFKKLIYPLTHLFLMIDNISNNRKVIVFDDKRTLRKTDKGTVYASNHIGPGDIEAVLTAINKQVYFVMGDAEDTYKGFQHVFLDYMLGRIILDTGYPAYREFQKHREEKTQIASYEEYLKQIPDIAAFIKKAQSLGIPLTEADLELSQEELAELALTKEEQALYQEYKDDRKIALEMCIKRLQRGDDILIFPQGAYYYRSGFSDRYYDGASRILIEGNGLLCPVGVTFDSKSMTAVNNSPLLVNIGKEIDISGAQPSDIKDITKEYGYNMQCLLAEMRKTNPDKVDPKFITKGIQAEINALLGEMVFKENIEFYLPGDNERSSFGSFAQIAYNYLKSVLTKTQNGYGYEIIEKTAMCPSNNPEYVVGSPLYKGPFNPDQDIVPPIESDIEIDPSTATEARLATSNSWLSDAENKAYVKTR